MDEVVKTKKGLVIEYIFYSIMVIALIFEILVVSILFQPEYIINLQVRLGCMLGYISFIFIMAIILVRSLNALFDVIYKLSEGDYE